MAASAMSELRVPRIRRRLLAWFRTAGRVLPWRNTVDPYRIWVSEIMLQQTRVATVLPYYERFLARFPDVASLAGAPDDKLLAAWSGLGYYSRVRNMKRAAQTMDGQFPRSHADIRALPGVGDYTAAAVASIAYGEAVAAVDGNVLRVLARVANDSGDVGSPAVKQRLAQLASVLLDPAFPGAFNEALMELGATVCLPRAPRCSECPVAEDCRARSAGRQNELPVKLGRKEPLRLERTACIVRRRGCVLLRRRGREERRMPDFWELPELHELPGAAVVTVLGEFRHCITHHRYRYTVVSAELRQRPKDWEWIRESELAAMPLSTITRKALALLKDGQAAESA